MSKEQQKFRQRKLAEIEKRNLQYLNLFRIFISLFFFALIHFKLGELFNVLYFHRFAAITSKLYLFASVVIYVVCIFAAQKTASITGKIGLFIDVPMLIYLAYSIDGVAAGLAILPILTIGSAAILFRKPHNILLAPIAAAILLWFTPQLVGLPAQMQIQWNSFLPHALAYFAIALVGIRQSISYYASVSLTQRQHKRISSLQSINQTIINKMNNGVVVFQDDGVIIQANKSAKKMLDLNDEVFLPERLMQAIKEQPDGTVYQNDKGTDIFISLAKLMEESRLRLMFLEDSKLLKKTAQQLNLASLGKLSSTIAHEIRNPLSAINTAAQLLEESEKINQEDKELTQIISAQTARANKIIEDILQISRRKIAQSEVISLNAFLVKFKETFCGIKKIDPKGLELVVSRDFTLTFDQNHLTQIIWNLASNALIHAETHHIQIIAHEGTLDVKNPGEPIPEDKREELFNPFFTTHTKGTGLGLYICRELCKANNATLNYLHANGFNIFRIEWL